MINFQTIRTRPRGFRQLTGLSRAAFERPDDDARPQRDRQRSTPRQRRPGGGANGVLPTAADKLLFLLFSFRQYPTQEPRAFLFGFSQGQACPWIPRLSPIVPRALGSQWQWPARKPADRQEVLAACLAQAVVIARTERPIRRPQDRHRRQQDSSGPSKRHPKKTIVITDKASGKVLGLGPTHAGSHHDKACADADGFVFPEGSTLDQDTGVQKYEPEGITTHQPRKQPRGREWTPEEKASNRLISRIRAPVEHRIGGIKVLRIVHDVFCNLKEGFVALMMETACGWFNLRLASRSLT